MQSTNLTTVTIVDVSSSVTVELMAAVLNRVKQILLVILEIWLRDNWITIAAAVDTVEPG